MKKTTTIMVDDLDGTEGTEDNEVSTVEFALDGAFMEIDLSEENADRLRDLLAEYVAHSRHVRGRRLKSKHVNGSKAPNDAPKTAPTTAPKAPPRKPFADTNGSNANGANGSTNGSSRAEVPTVTFLEASPADIRRWAKSRRIPIPDRGRIPESVKALFVAASRGKDAKE
jgi:hypothetical protein